MHGIPVFDDFVMSVSVVDETEQSFRAGFPHFISFSREVLKLPGKTVRSDGEILRAKKL